MKELSTRLCLLLAARTISVRGWHVQPFSRPPFQLASSTSNEIASHDAAEHEEDSTLLSPAADNEGYQEQTNYGLSDSEFNAWVQSELFQDPLYEDYQQIFEQAATAITNWRQRYRGNPKLWRRLFKKDRVFKEFVEAAPIIHAVVNLIEESDLDHYTIIDLASGKGYLSMFLSEMLPPEKVHGLVLMDKAWPRQDQPLQDHHISWEHIYGSSNTTTTIPTASYYDSWPIPLVTSKQDLKQKSTHRTLQKRFFSKAKGPIVVLAVHLCGTLSLRAVDMFNQNPESIAFLALKPCCLPPMVHARRDEVFEIGRHTFMADQVCSNGRFNGKRWYGPPRWHLVHRFQLWAENLFLGVDTDNASEEEEEKARVKVTVQRDGGYQNAFIFAQRAPVSRAVWEGLNKVEVSSFLEETGKEEQQ